MLLSYEILEEKYNKLVADKEAMTADTTLSDEDRATRTADFDRDLAELDEGMFTLAKEEKRKIDEATARLNEKIAENEEKIANAEAELELKKAELEAEMAKKTPDESVVNAKNAEIKGLEKQLKEYKKTMRKIHKEIDGLNEKLLPIMNRFGDRELFTPEEMKNLKRIKRNVARRKPKTAVVEEPTTPEPAAEEPTTPEPTTPEPTAEEPVVPGTGSGTGTPSGRASGPVVPGGSGSTSTPGRTTVTGGSRTVASAAAPTAEEPVELSMEEFNSIYRLAKEKQLSEVHIKKLLPILSDPKAYTKYGITTGLFRNKAKTLYTAMGDYMAKGYRTTISQVKSVYGIDPKQDFGKGVVPSSELTSWKGIKTLASKPATKTKAEVIYSKVVEAGDAKIAEGKELRGEDERLYLLAKKELGTMEAFRGTLEVHKKVVAKRRLNPISWLTGREKLESLPEAPATDDGYRAIHDAVRTDISRVGRDAVEDYDRTMRTAGIMTLLASDSSEGRSHSAPAEGPEAPAATGMADMRDTLAASVYPPEEIDTTVGESTSTEAPEIGTFDGLGIDG